MRWKLVVGLSGFGVLAAGAGWLMAARAARSERPALKVADGWRADLVARAPDILFPTAIATAPDGTLFLGQDPMDMPGPPTQPLDSIVTIRGRGKDRTISVFADKLWSVMGLEYIDGTLYVVHAPYLSAFEVRPDGTAGRRVDLITGLGPKLPGFNGINDHIASGIRLGMDGFLYISVGDKGIPRGVGRDGTTIQLFGGGVIRIRPDGTGLEVVSTGQRNILSVALSDDDDAFTYDNDDDSKTWPNNVAHVIDGGHYGYPYQFQAAPEKCLPLLAGQIGGSATQGIVYGEDGLPARYRGNLFVCDWGVQRVFRYELEPAGGTFRAKRRSDFVAPGRVLDFRPFAILPAADGRSLYLVDWAYGGWLTRGLQTGRLWQLTYTGPDRVQPVPRGADSDPLDRQVAALDHPARAERLRAQRALVRLGARAVEPLVKLLRSNAPSRPRKHAIWALDAISTPAARAAILAALSDPQADVRRQAARAAGIRRTDAAVSRLLVLLHDQDTPVRREAAIALGRIGDGRAVPPLIRSMNEPDRFTRFSIRTALRRIGRWDEDGLVAALTSGDSELRNNLLLILDEVWSVPVVKALARVAAAAPDRSTRRNAVQTLAHAYYRYPPWDGAWFGTNPLVGRFPARTAAWDQHGMAIVFKGLTRALGDREPAVRRAAIDGLAGIGPAAAAPLRGHLAAEPDTANRRAVIAALGKLGDHRAVGPLAAITGSDRQPLAVRSAAADALAAIGTPDANALLLAFVRQPEPYAGRPDRHAGDREALIARILPVVARDPRASTRDLAEFLAARSAAIRVGALTALTIKQAPPAAVEKAVLPQLDDRDPAVVRAAIGAAGSLKMRSAIPRLIGRAQDPAYRQEAIEALAQMPDPRALDLYLAGLGERNPTVRAVCQTALRAIRDQVGVELERRARQGQIDSRAMPVVERVLARFEPIRQWRVIGPFPRTTADVFVHDRTIDFNEPQTGAAGMTIRWMKATADRDTGRVNIDFMKAGAGDRGGFGYDTTGSPDLCAFGHAVVDAPTAHDALMLVGSSGTLTVLINDRQVYNYVNFAGRAYSPDSDLVQVHLAKGPNQVLVRSRQGIGAWSFGLQLSQPRPSVFAAAGGTKADIEDLRRWAMAHDGDPQRGRSIFFDPRGIGCVKCHSVSGTGGKVGPDLAGIAAKYDRAEIISSVLEPSKRITQGYQPVLVATVDGKVITGILREETEQALELVDADAHVIRVPKAEIDERRISDVSIMPVGLVDTLSRREFADLIAFLTILKQGAAPK